MPDATAIADRLRRVGQDHVLRFFDSLDSGGQARLLRQLEAIDIEGLPALADRYVFSDPSFDESLDLEPAPYYPRTPDPEVRDWDPQEARREGEALIRAGRVAAFTVAGGQGTRLGHDGPKGMYPAGAVTGKPLFHTLAEWILAAERRYGATIPWYVMTSPLNHDATTAFFEKCAWFGLERANVRFFQQGVMPSLDRETGRLLLAAPDQLVTNPDGHGGSLLALHASGALDDMRRRGVEHISYTQIDNPLVRVVDPVFLGLHAGAPDSSAQMSSKFVPKAHAKEKVGLFCNASGRTRIIEYSDLPDELAEQTDARGGLRFNAGNIAVHAIGRAFVHELNTRVTAGMGVSSTGFALPYHRAIKKAPHLDIETGRLVQPEEPNAVKLEAFVFDAIPLCERPLLYETERIEEFAPIKNAQGADSPESCSRIQTERAARWLEAAGVDVPRDDEGRPDCVLEVSPLTAMFGEDLRRADLPRRIGRGEKIAL